MIPHNKPTFPMSALKRIERVLSSGQLIPGHPNHYCEQVEDRWCELTGAESACMVGTGVGALRLALMALDVGKLVGDEVIIPAYSCTALHNAVTSAGANYVLGDIWPYDFTLSLDDILLRTTEETGAIIFVHTFGAKCEVPAFIDDIRTIEDMSHGIFKQYADLAIASFGPTKLIGSIYGGIVSGERSLINKVRDFRDYGNKAPSLRQNDMPNEISAAIALTQLEQLDDIRHERHRKALYYSELLAGVDVPRNREWFYRYVIQVEDAERISKEMKVKGVEAHRQIVYDYREEVAWPSDLPNSDRIFDRGLSLPFFPTITIEEQNEVVKVLQSELK